MLHHLRSGIVINILIRRKIITNINLRNLVHEKISLAKKINITKIYSWNLILQAFNLRYKPRQRMIWGILPKHSTISYIMEFAWIIL